MADDNLINEILKENGRDMPSSTNSPEGGDKPAGDKPAGEEEGADGGDKEKPGGGAKPAGDKPAGDKPAGEEEGADDDDIDEEQLKKYLKKKGIEVDSIDDLKKPKQDDKPLTDEEKAEQKKQFRENAIKYALNKEGSTIKTSDITAYENDLAKTPREIVYPIITAKWKQEDSSLTQDQLDERFSDFYAEGEAEDSWIRKERNDLMKSQAQFFVNKKHEKVLGLEGEYENHLNTINNAKAYNLRVENVLKTFSVEEPFDFDVEFEGGAKEKANYKYEFSKEDIAEVRALLLSKESFAKLGSSETTDEVLNNTAKSILRNKRFNDIVRTVAVSHANKMVLAAKAGRKGIPTHDGGGTRQDNQPPKESLIDDILKENNR